MNTLCAFCGQTATGLATITTDLDGERRYCHGDDAPTPTCYEQAQWAMSGVRPDITLLQNETRLAEELAT